jgi:hypothetical protein
VCRWQGLAADVAVIVAVSSAQVVRWQADPDRRATRPEDRKRAVELRITRVFPCVAHVPKARASFMFAGGRSWPSLATDGSSGTSRGHALAMRRPDCRSSGAVARPSVFQAGHIPSWHRSCESYALSPVAGACRWLLLLLSPLLSAPFRMPLPGCPLEFAW